MLFYQKKDTTFEANIYVVSFNDFLLVKRKQLCFRYFPPIWGMIHSWFVNEMSRLYDFINHNEPAISMKYLSNLSCARYSKSQSTGYNFKEFYGVLTKEFKIWVYHTYGEPKNQHKKYWTSSIILEDHGISSGEGDSQE